MKSSNITKQAKSTQRLQAFRKCDQPQHITGQVCNIPVKVLFTLKIFCFTLVEILFSIGIAFFREPDVLYGTPKHISHIILAGHRIYSDIFFWICDQLGFVHKDVAMGWFQCGQLQTGEGIMTLCGCSHTSILNFITSFTCCSYGINAWEWIRVTDVLYMAHI